MTVLHRLPLLCIALSAVWVGMVRGADDGLKQAGAILFKNVCSACHGQQGQGAELLKVPTLAGRPGWYVERQLENFRAGRRGTNPAEPQAFLMASMAKTLSSEQLKAVALYINGLEIIPPVLAKHDDAEVNLGRELFQERCMECHRFNASGEMTFGSPPLLGLPEWYMIAQIRKFKSGERGAVPGDQFGAKMVLSSRFIESEEALRGVVAYIASLNPAAKATADVDSLFTAPSSVTSSAGK